ncbi:MAG: ATP-binding protein, partial [Anaerolineales bacterium]|nr:ATP-binding protein [Anaerolineales bacterium]
MSAEDAIRLHFPQSLAKLYEAARLESAPELRVIKLLRLFEETTRHLALVGLAGCTARNLTDDKVAAARADLGRPSLGHWLALLKAVSVPLQNSDLAVLTPPLAYRLKPDSALMMATVKLAASAGVDLPARVRLEHFLDAVGQFRNKKHGHGTLSAGEARQVVAPLEAGLLEWLDGLTILQQRKLVYIDRCEWAPPAFAYIGTDLNSGTSLYPATLQGSQPLAPKQVYLGPTPDLTDQEFLPLHPFFAFDNDNLLLYSYNELSNQGQPLLRCAYDLSGLHDSLTLDAPASAILGDGLQPTPAPAPSQTARKSGAAKRDDKDTSMDIPGLKNWYDIIPPHEDIRKGNFDEAIFAADLGDVADGVAPPDYRDPYLFFKKTYPTQGLQNLLSRVQETLTTGKGSSVIQIQTPFGGGKTHALVAIYHYLTNGQRVKELLPAGLELLSPKVSVVAGNHWDPIAGRTTDGVSRRTFWGEIAWQIGGAAGYEMFRDNDEA